MEERRETLSTAVNRLQKDGYTNEILEEEFKALKSADWRIDEICRFEGMLNPADNSILYAIAHKKDQI